MTVDWMFSLGAKDAKPDPSGALMCALGVMLFMVGVSPARAQQLSEPESEFPVVNVVNQPLEYRQFDKVEITGSAILRKEQTQSLPVQVVTRAEIQKSGKQSIADYLQSLPAVFNSYAPAMLGTLQSGYSAAAVHGQQIGTLVLVNGRRLAGYGRQTSFGTDNGGVDLNTLPLSAVDRVEILTDGASSTYGTDAQSGVINIITRTDRPGVEITADQRMPDGQHGLGRRVDLSVGHGRLAHDGYSWFVTAEVQDQQELLGRDRPYASAGRYVIQQNGRSYRVDGAGLTADQTRTTLASSESEPWSRLWNADGQSGTCAKGQVLASDQPACLDNLYVAKGLVPASKAVRVHAQGQWQLSSDITAYSEFSWRQDEQRRTYNGWRPYAAKIGNTPGSPGYDLALAHGFDPAQGVWLLYNGAELGLGSRWFGMASLRAVMGVKGLWQSWDFHGSFYYSDNHATFDSNAFSPYPNLGVDSQGVLTNPALLSSLWSNTPAAQQLRQQLQAMMLPRETFNEGSIRLQGLDFKASRSLAEWDGRDVLLAVGADLRQEQGQYDQYRTGVPSYRGQRNVFAQFAELQMPLPHDVEVLASLRNDHYSDFGNTLHGKLSAKWAPNSQWLVRGAWGSGFRAPAVAQMQDTGKTIVSSFQSPCTSELLAQATRLGGICPVDGVYNIYSQGSSKLKPELSSQLNMGLRFMPDRNHTLSIDYWRVDKRDKINSLLDAFPLTNLARYANNFELNSNRELQLFTPMINLGKTQISGFDFSWLVRRPTPWGQLHMGVTGTRVLASRYQRAEGQPFESDLNVDSVYSGVVVPKLRSRWHLGLQQESWFWQATLHHTAGHDTAPFDAVEIDTGKTVTLEHVRVPAWWTVDLLATHQWGPKTHWRIGVENVFNRQAPVDLAYVTSFNVGTNPMMANVWGRTVHVSLTHRF